MRRRLHSGRAVANERMRNLEAAAKAFKGFRPASETLMHVRAVPTIFLQYDHATRVGGHPTERITLAHGPSGEGKTYWTLGQAKSFLRVDHPAMLVDAERTTDKAFAKLALGDHMDHPMFFYERPDTYEDTRARVRLFCNSNGELRAKGHDSCGLVVVDSIRKLVPKDQWEQITKLATDPDIKARDRSAQIKALMNAAWCDELIPLLEQTGCTMIIIARETADPDAKVRPGMNYKPVKTGGGSALYYDASLDVRIERARYVTKETGEKLQPTVYGERHRITIKKSKIAGKDDKTTVCYFHTSNGKLVPAGFDPARDTIELAKRFGIVKGTGWLKWGNHKWQGEHAAVKKLSATPELLAELQAEVRAEFKSIRPAEENENGTVTTEDGEIIE